MSLQEIGHDHQEYFESAKRGDLKRVQSLIEGGIEIDTVDEVSQSGSHGRDMHTFIIVIDSMMYCDGFRYNNMRYPNLV